MKPFCDWQCLIKRRRQCALESIGLIIVRRIVNILCRTVGRNKASITCALELSTPRCIEFTPRHLDSLFLLRRRSSCVAVGKLSAKPRQGQGQPRWLSVLHTAEGRLCFTFAALLVRVMGLVVTTLGNVVVTSILIGAMKRQGAITCALVCVVVLTYRHIKDIRHVE